MSAPVRIPKRFYQDHQERELPTPPAVRETARHVWVDPDHRDLAELLSDARFYASEAMYMDPPRPGLASSARATVRALEGVVDPMRGGGLPDDRTDRPNTNIHQADF